MVCVGLFDELRRLVAFETAHTDHEYVPMTTRKDRRDDIPDARAFGGNVRLAEREGVDVRLVVEARKTVVHEAVRALVASDGVHDVQELGVGSETPIVLGDLRCG